MFALKDDIDMKEVGNTDNRNDDADTPEAGNNRDGEIAEMRDRLLRTAAEFENYKRRTQNDLVKAKEHGKVEIIRGILPAVDEFELALRAAGNGSGDVKQIFKGIEMVYANLVESLRRAGLEPIETESRYDPLSHEIVMSKESDRDYGVILEVIKRGYRLGSILVRPASVIISSGRREGSGAVEGSGESQEVGKSDNND